MIKPPRLRPGDVIGIASPSWGGAGLYPHRVERGVAALEAAGFRVRIAPNARHVHGFVSDTPENRAADLHALVADPEVRAIMAAIGGDHACHLLPLLDFDLIRRNLKIWLGYSDFAVLNVAAWQQTGLVTFNGPMLLTDLAEYPQPLEYTADHLWRTVCRAEPVGTIEPSPQWTEEFQDWAVQKSPERPRALRPSPGWSWLREGSGEGVLIGGCLESLEHLRGTRFWPDWQGAILFLETSEEHPTPATVDGILMDYENMGVLAQLQGLLVGRPMRYSAVQKEQLRRVIRERTAGYRFPIVADMDFGHTAPQCTLPIGCRARIDGDRHEFSLLEAAVS